MEMVENTKVRIDLKQGIIELEGSETFVQKNLDEFKSLIKQQPIEGISPTRAAKKKEAIEKPAKKPKKRLPKTVESEEFAVRGEGIPSLKEFFQEKNPDSNLEINAVLGYYIQNYAKRPEISEGNYAYGYKAIGKKRPKFLHQSIIDTKNKKGWIKEGSSTDTWKLTSAGEDYVMYELPLKKDDQQD